MRPTLLAVLTLGPVALAQTAVVSPLTLAASEGNSSSLIPFGAPTPMRYQQIHSDLTPPARAIRGLSFRQNAGTGTFTGTRVCDMELTMSAAVRSDAASFIFQTNRLGAATLVVTRKNVNFGPQGAAASPGPSSFTGMSIVFDTPFAFSGNGSVLWDVQVHGGSASGSFAPLDAHDFGRAALQTTLLGTGCTATGASSPLKSDVDGFTCGTMTYYGPLVVNGIPNAPAVLALGARDPQLSIPGLCTLSRTDLVITNPLGSCDQNGEIFAFGSNVLRAQNALPGGKVFSQIFLVDLNRADPFKLAGSNGVETTIPATTAIPPVSRIYTDGGRPTDLVAPLRGDTIGFGIVTRFDV